MEYIVDHFSLSNVEDSVILGIYKNEALEGCNPINRVFNKLTQDYLLSLIESQDVSSEKGVISLLRHIPHSDIKRVFIVGLGEKEQDLTPRDLKKIYTDLYKEIAKTPTKVAINYLLDQIKSINSTQYWHLRFAVEALEQARYVFDQFKTQNKSTPASIECFAFHVDKDKNKALCQKALKQAQAIALGVNATKDLANLPPNVCNPTYLATEAEKLAHRSSKITTYVIDEKAMQELGMTSYLTVSQGSQNEAKMSVMTYTNAPNPDAKPIVLVGKGLTFDSGGISIKPSASMDEMKYDMCGAATVFGVMNALVALELPINVIGIMAGCENMPDGNAYRPGDIIKTMAGLTVEVLNTDAEGRLVLCDALTYVKRFNPECVIDIATLTGACVVALGSHNTGLMTENENLAKDLLKAGIETQDKAWRLPLGEEYNEQIKSPFADIANIGGRWGGASTAGAFLSYFTKDYPWAHLDIAGTAWQEGISKGATGRPVHLLLQFLINQIK